jgi:hypothetical protein
MLLGVGCVEATATSDEGLDLADTCRVFDAVLETGLVRFCLATLGTSLCAVTIAIKSPSEESLEKTAVTFAPTARDLPLVLSSILGPSAPNGLSLLICGTIACHIDESEPSGREKRARRSAQQTSTCASEKCAESGPETKMPSQKLRAA